MNRDKRKNVFFNNNMNFAYLNMLQDQHDMK